MGVSSLEVSTHLETFLTLLSTLDVDLRNQILAAILGLSPLKLKDILSSCPHEDTLKILNLAPKVANELAAEVRNVGFEIPDVTELPADGVSPPDSDDSPSASDTESLIPRPQTETPSPQRQRLATLEFAPHMIHSPKFIAKLTVALLTVCLGNYGLAAATVVQLRESLSWIFIFSFVPPTISVVMMAVYIQIFLSPDPGRLAGSKFVFEVLKRVNVGGWCLEILFLLGGIPAGSYGNQFRVSMAKGVLASYGLGVGFFVWEETRERASY